MEEKRKTVHCPECMTWQQETLLDWTTMFCADCGSSVVEGEINTEGFEYGIYNEKEKPMLVFWKSEK